MLIWSFVRHFQTIPNIGQLSHVSLSVWFPIYKIDKTCIVECIQFWNLKKHAHHERAANVIELLSVSRSPHSRFGSLRAVRFDAPHSAQLILLHGIVNVEQLVQCISLEPSAGMSTNCFSNEKIETRAHAHRCNKSQRCCCCCVTHKRLLLLRVGNWHRRMGLSVCVWWASAPALAS